MTGSLPYRPNHVPAENNQVGPVQQVTAHQHRVGRSSRRRYRRRRNGIGHAEQVGDVEQGGPSSQVQQAERIGRLGRAEQQELAESGFANEEMAHLAALWVTYYIREYNPVMEEVIDFEKRVIDFFDNQPRIERWLDRTIRAMDELKDTRPGPSLRGRLRGNHTFMILSKASRTDRAKEQLLRLENERYRWTARAAGTNRSIVGIWHAPGKGLGVFTVRRVAAQDVIFTDRPLCVLPKYFWLQHGDWEGPRSLEPEVTSDIYHHIRRLFWTMSATTRQAVLSLMGGDTARAAWITLLHNSILFPIAENEFGIYLTASRLNHDCMPNAICFTSNTDGRCCVVAQRTIYPGEEITIYYDQTWKHKDVAERHMEQWLVFRFECGCRPCRIMMRRYRSLVARYYTTLQTWCLVLTICRPKTPPPDLEQDDGMR